MKTYIGIITLGACLAGGLTSCNDFLDMEPLDKVTPEAYFASDADLAAYTINAYPFPTTDGYLGSSPLLKDNGTDNQAGTSNDAFWMPGQKKVPAGAGDWSWDKVRACNYFFDNVLPKYEAGQITGTDEKIRHYIGEMYVIRAYNYYRLLVSLGDLPIVATALPDIKEELMEASKRQPRHKVADFILNDLKDALGYLQEMAPEGTKTRINRDVALLLRARVALFEATWEKYHAGTAFVPNGTGWPGDKELAKDYDNADKWIEHFLSIAMESSKELGDKMYTKLANNTKEREGMSASLQSLNPYYTMFCDENMDGYEEVLLWRQFKEGFVTHSAQMELCRNGGGSGWTKGMVDSYVMENGYPIYDNRSGYKKEWENQGVEKTLEGRDPRIVIFTKKPGDVDFYKEDGTPSNCVIGYIFGTPASTMATTGFIVKKGKHYSPIMASTDSRSTSGTVVFRGAEALLTYMEASYEYYMLKGAPRVDETADKYWRALRKRAGVEEDYMITVNATQMEKEALGDFGAYSHGQLLADKTLYNIRRERRNELCGENTRWDDLKRWRACDQLKNQPYRIQGMKYWGTRYETELADKCKVDPTTGNMSPSSLGDYIVPYERISVNNTISNQGGFLFTPAHYLNPIGMAAFRETAVTDGDFSSSVIYQNPGWKIQADSGPEPVE